MNDVERPAHLVLKESTGMLALLATRGLYDEQPDLWRMGERGRERTLEDFTHHFRALEVLDDRVFRRHVEYCQSLFQSRGFPQKWLDDAWRWMKLVIERELPPAVARPALAVLSAGTASPEQPI